MVTVEYFICACREGNLSEVKKCIEEDKSIVNKKGYVGLTGLMEAVEHHNTDIVKGLEIPIVWLEALGKPENSNNS